MAKIVDTLRLSEQQVQVILDELETHQDSERLSKRKARRWSLGVTKIVISVADGATNWVHHLAVARNLSSGGAAVMLGAFVHNDTICKVCIRNRKGQVQQVAGRVVRCSLIRGRVHDVGIAFDSAIHSEDFIDLGNEEYVFDAEHVDPEGLKGQVLIVEGNRAEQKLLAHHYRNTHLDLEFASDGDTGLSILKQCIEIDIVLLGYVLSDMSGLHFVERAREVGYGGALVVLTGERTADLRSILIAGGADELLHKPCTEDLLLRATHEYLCSPAREGSGPIDCGHSGTGLPPHLVCEFIDELIEKSEKIADAIEQDEIDQIRAIIQQIRSSSPNFGLGVIGDLAHSVLKQLDASMSIEESMEALQRLQLAVRRIRRPKVDETEVQEESLSDGTT